MSLFHRCALIQQTCIDRHELISQTCIHRHELISQTCIHRHELIQQMCICSTDMHPQTLTYSTDKHPQTSLLFLHTYAQSCRHYMPKVYSATEQWVTMDSLVLKRTLPVLMLIYMFTIRGLQQELVYKPDADLQISVCEVNPVLKR